MDSETIHNLQNLVHDCLAKHMYDAAIFFADKLVTLSEFAPAEVYALAQAFFIERQYHRCLKLLQSADVVDKDIRFRYLAARCLAEIKDWEQCLDLLGGIEADGYDGLLSLPAPPSSPGATLDFISASCLLRGKVFEALENFTKAIHWYKLALVRDPFNVEAFQALVEHHKLDQSEEASFVSSIAASLPEQHRWLGLLYKSKCFYKFDQVGRPIAEQALEDLLENQSPNQPQAQPSIGGRSRTSPPMTLSCSNQESRQNQRHQSVLSSMTISPIKEELTSENQSPGGSSCAAGGVSGIDFSTNGDVVASRANLMCRAGRWADAYALTSTVLERDPYHDAVLPVHIAAAVQLGKKHELFALGHKLTSSHPDRALPWYAAGCYYYISGQYNSARQFFGKATKLDRSFAPGWLAFAAAFSAQDETDQALAAYRSAARLFPGLHDPLLGMGLEYARMNNIPLAEQILLSAHKRCPADLSVRHEIGTLAYKSGRYEEAVQWLSQVAAAAPKTATHLWEPALVNLGHALRKLRRWDEALHVFQQALGVAPFQSGTLAAIGFTHHMIGNVGVAIEYYHKSLGLRGDDHFVSTMLSIAVAEDRRVIPRSQEDALVVGMDMSSSPRAEY